MSYNARTKVCAADVIVCLLIVILALAVIMFPSHSAGNTVSVKTSDSDLVFDLSRDHTETLHSADHILTIEIRNGAVRISDSNCADGVCVSAGWIKNPSQMIVCAPAKVVVRILNTGGESDADFIAGR